MNEYRNIHYEVKQGDNSKFWHAYFHKLIGPNHYELINIMSYLGEPSDERIHATIDQEIYEE